MESILTSIKKLLGIEEQYTHFDQDIIIHINTTFLDLNQIGVGPKEGFRIKDASTNWSEFLPEADMLKMEAVKTYMYLKVKLVFDPPTSSAVMESFKNMADKLEWRLNVQAESKTS